MCTVTVMDKADQESAFIRRSIDTGSDACLEISVSACWRCMHRPFLRETIPAEELGQQRVEQLVVAGLAQEGGGGGEEDAFEEAAGGPAHQAASAGSRPAAQRQRPVRQAQR